MTETDIREIYYLIDHLHKIAERQQSPDPGLMHMVANTMDVLLEEIQELKQLMNEE